MFCHTLAAFQKQNVDLSLLQLCLKTAIDSIKQYETCQGPNLSRLDEVLSTDLKDFNITPTEAQKQEFKSAIQKKYIQAIVTQLQNRFPDVDYLDAFSIFDPQKLLSASPSDGDELTVYGQEKLEHLKNAYGGGGNPDIDCAGEWESLKRLFANNFSDRSMRQMTSLLSTDTSLQDMYPNLSKLASIAALVPVSTAECERSFSTMNRVKTKLRNRMRTSTLDSLIRISMGGPPLPQFNFERAADIWGTLRLRFISFLLLFILTLTVCFCDISTIVILYHKFCTKK